METDKIKRREVNECKNDHAHRNGLVTLFVYGHYEKKLKCKCKAFYVSLASYKETKDTKNTTYVNLPCNIICVIVK